MSDTNTVKETWVCEDNECVCHTGSVFHYSDDPAESIAHQHYINAISHYYDTKIGLNILALDSHSKVRAFQMLSDYADVLEKIFEHEKSGIPILDYILGKLDTRPALATNTSYDADQGINCPIIKEYKAWKDSQQ
jgi:hypothetical protein